MNLRLLPILAIVGNFSVATPPILDSQRYSANRHATAAAAPDAPKPYTAEIPDLDSIGVYPRDWPKDAPVTGHYLVSDAFGQLCTNAVEQYLERHDPATAVIRRNNRAAHLEYEPRGHLFFSYVMDDTVEWYLASTCTSPGKGGDIGARGTCRYIIEKNRTILEFTVTNVASTLRLPIDNTASPSGKGKLCLDLTDPVFGKNIYPEIPVVIEKQTPPGTVVQKTPFTRFGTDDTYNHNVIETSWNDDETAVLVTQHWKWHSEIYLYAETADHRYIRSGNLSEECEAALERHIHAFLPELARKRAHIAEKHSYTLQGDMRFNGHNEITWEMHSSPPKHSNWSGDFDATGTLRYSMEQEKLIVTPAITSLQPNPEQENDADDEKEMPEETEDLCDIILRMYSE